jgi:hypothetical protein
MNLVEFLTNQRPVCDRFPFYNLFSDNYELYVILKNRSIADFGENLFAKRCSNRFFCSTSCVGRPIPKYPELDGVIKHSNKLESGIYKGKEVWLLTVIDCEQCPVKTSCNALCGSMVSFLDKHDAEEAIYEDKLIPLESLIEEDLSEAMEAESAEIKGFDLSLVEDIPWDCLTSNQRYIIQAKFYTMKSEREISEDLDIHVRAVQKMVGTALSKLKEFSKARECLASDKSNKFADLYYGKCLTQTQIADLNNCSTMTVSRKLKEFTDKYNL